MRLSLQANGESNSGVSLSIFIVYWIVKCIYLQDDLDLNGYTLKESRALLPEHPLTLQFMIQRELSFLTKI